MADPYPNNDLSKNPDSEWLSDHQKWELQQLGFFAGMTALTGLEAYCVHKVVKNSKEGKAKANESRVFDIKEKIANQLLSRGHATVDELLEGSFGEWPPKGLDIVGVNDQRVRLMPLLQMMEDHLKAADEETTKANQQKELDSAGGRATINGNREIGINDRAIEKGQPKASVLGHETIHILEGDHTDYIRAKSAYGLDFAQQMSSSKENVAGKAASILFDENTDREAVSKIAVPESLAKLGGLEYIKGGFEIQARLHQMLMEGYPRWGRLPRNHEELTVALIDTGLKPPQQVLDELEKSSTIKQTRKTFSKLNERKTYFSEALNYAQSNLTEEGQVKMWKETMPVMYSDLIEMYGDKLGRERFGLGKNTRAQMRLDTIVNPERMKPLGAVLTDHGIFDTTGHIAFDKHTTDKEIRLFAEQNGFEEASFHAYWEGNFEGKPVKRFTAMTKKTSDAIIDWSQKNLPADKLNDSRTAQISEPSHFELTKQGRVLIGFPEDTPDNRIHQFLENSNFENRNGMPIDYDLFKSKSEGKAGIYIYRADYKDVLDWAKREMPNELELAKQNPEVNIQKLKQDQKQSEKFGEVTKAAREVVDEIQKQTKGERANYQAGYEPITEHITTKVTQNLGKANVLVGGSDTITRLASGDNTGAAVSAVQTTLGTFGDGILKKVATIGEPGRAGIVGVVTTGVAAVGDTIDMYQKTGSITQAAEAGGIATLKVGTVTAAMGLAAPTSGAITTSLLTAAGVESAAETGAVVATWVGATVSTGGLVLAGAAAAYGIKKAGEEANAKLDKAQQVINEQGHTTDLEKLDFKGLPLIDAEHNKELAQIITQNPTEAKQLSSNPGLAAKGITNAQDPAYIQNKLDELRTNVSHTDNRGFFGTLVDAPDSKKITEQSALGIAEIQKAAYQKRFDQKFAEFNAQNVLPVLDNKHHPDLAAILEGDPDAKKLSSNPQLAGKSLTNSQDPAYLQKKVDDARQAVMNMTTTDGDSGAEVAVSDEEKSIRLATEITSAQHSVNVYKQAFDRKYSVPNAPTASTMLISQNILNQPIRINNSPPLTPAIIPTPEGLHNTVENNFPHPPAPTEPPAQVPPAVSSQPESQTVISPVIVEQPLTQPQPAIASIPLPISNSQPQMSKLNTTHTAHNVSEPTHQHTRSHHNFVLESHHQQVSHQHQNANKITTTKVIDGQESNTNSEKNFMERVIETTFHNIPHKILETLRHANQGTLGTHHNGDKITSPLIAHANEQQITRT